MAETQTSADPCKDGHLWVIIFPQPQIQTGKWAIFCRCIRPGCQEHAFVRMAGKKKFWEIWDLIQNRIKSNQQPSETDLALTDEDVNEDQNEPELDPEPEED